MDPVGRGGGGGGIGGMEARRLLEISEKLLDSRDLDGSKRFAERALETDPLFDGVDQILAVVDVLLASQRRVNNHLDSYSILQLPHPPSSAADDALAIKRSYRRLALLLSPDRNRFLLADSALRFVVDAYAVLSDPAKKSLLDAELQMVASHLQSNGSAADAAVRQPDRAFWTSCPSCCHVFEYDRSYLNRTLRCRTCRKPFHAGEMAEKPPIVPGADMYYCAWGFFPLGFRGGPAFTNSGAAAVPEFGEGWKPFYPMSPWWDNQLGGQPEKPLNAVPVNVAAAAAANQNDSPLNRGMPGSLVPRKRGRPPKNKQAVAKRSVASYPRTKSYSGGAELRNEGTEARGARGLEADAAIGASISHFDIDLDATEDVLGNLGNLHTPPFLREEDIQIQLP